MNGDLNCEKNICHVLYTLLTYRFVSKKIYNKHLYALILWLYAVCVWVAIGNFMGLYLTIRYTSVLKCDAEKDVYTKLISFLYVSGQVFVGNFLIPSWT